MGAFDPRDLRVGDEFDKGRRLFGLSRRVVLRHASGVVVEWADEHNADGHWLIFDANFGVDEPITRVIREGKQIYPEPEPVAVKAKTMGASELAIVLYYHARLEATIAQALADVLCARFDITPKETSK